MISEREWQALSADGSRLAALYRKGQNAPLLTEVDQLAKEGPLQPDVLGVASLALTALERYAEAIKAAEGALALAPDQAWLFSALAAGYAGQGDLARAVASQRRAAQLSPAAAEHTINLVRYIRMAGEAESAAKVARQAMLQHPAHAGLHVELGLSLLDLGQRAEALAQLRAAQQAAPGDFSGYENEGVLHLRSGDQREARRALRKSLQRSPGRTESENLMAATLGTPGSVFRHLLDLGRVNLIGWLIIVFLYYLLFRLMEFFWKQWPQTLPLGRMLLLGALCYLVGGLLVGRTLRLLFRTNWPK
jgi:Flp pilus assembly protein TadD